MSASKRYPGFKGRIDRTIHESTPHWEERPRPPEGAPNVVIILCDDLGFADIGSFGSEIDTPTIDFLADHGLRYTNFHTTPLCGPTRAALLTGINPHRVGFGFTAEDYGFPGYRGSLSDAALSMGEIFRSNGYSTFALGKWHVTPRSGNHNAGEKGSWPLQRGFDRFYGLLDGRTNALAPHLLFEDNHVLEIDEYPEGYLLSDDITDQAISMIRSVKAADKTKPFFLYLAHTAPHSPLVAHARDIHKYRDRYKEGWDRIREERFSRQLKEGLFPEHTKMAPRNSETDFDVPAWADLTETQQQVFARYMEVYAAMVDNIDQNLGRLCQVLSELNELDNTVFIFTSDNGASREGGSQGTTELERHIWTVFMRLESESEHLKRDFERMDLIGGPRYNVHYPRGWAMAGNTPFRLYKSTTFNGGTRVPFVISWPSQLSTHGSLCNDFVHITDVLPTLVELIGLHVPDNRSGVPVEPFTGSSFYDTLRNPSAKREAREQYTEIRGERSYYRDGWEIVTLHYPGTEVGPHEWQLYHVAEDPTELHDLSDEYPELVEELASAWEQAAWENYVYPLDHDATALRALNHPVDDEIIEPLTLRPQDHTLPPMRAKRLVGERSVDIHAQLRFRAGDQGVLVAHGDQGGGYSLYIEHDEIVFAVNSYGTVHRINGGEVKNGLRKISLSVDSPGGNIWHASLLVDGVKVGRLEGLLGWTTDRPCEGIDVGIDRRSPVCWDIYERYGTFRFSGDLESVTYVPGAYAPDAIRRMAAALRETLLSDD